MAADGGRGRFRHHQLGCMNAPVSTAMGSGWDTHPLAYSLRHSIPPHVPHYEHQNQYYAVLNLVVTRVSCSRTTLPARLQRTFYRWAESGLLRPSTMWRSRQEQQGRRRYLYDSMREQKKAQVSLGLELFLGHSER